MSDPANEPMRVSAWQKPAVPNKQMQVPLGQPQETPAASAATQMPAEQSAGGLPVDPWRLFEGLKKRRRWVLFALTAGLLLGCGYGILKTKTRYQVTVQLIKHDTPDAFRVGEIGEAFRPRQLSGGTLVGAAGSVNVLQRVAEKSSPAVSAGELQNAIEVKEQRNTDFVYLTLSGYKSPAATVSLANLWAAEVVQFTRELQSQESREIRQFLQQQVDATDAELTKLNGQILDFSKRENLVDAGKQIDAYLRSLSDIDLKYETARINVDTVEFRIKGIEAELHRQSPLAEKLHTTQSELDELRTRYTDQNPLVAEKMEKIQSLEKDIKASEANDQADASSYAGTFLGNTLYLNLVQAQNDKKSYLMEKDELEKLRTQQRAKLDAIPEKAAAFAQLALKKQSLETARSLLFSRLREAQMFEENSPGYYRIFSPASIDGVISKSKILKTAIFAVAGGIFLALAVTMAALLSEFLDPKLRTGREAAKALQAPLLATISQSDADSALGSELWAHWIGAGKNPGQPRIVWSPSPGPEEKLFWELLFERAASLLPALNVVNCGSDSLPDAPAKIKIQRVNVENFSILEAEQLGRKLREDCRRGEEIWVRLAGPMHEPLTTIARCGLPALVLVRLHSEENDFWKTQGELLNKTIGSAAGVVAVGETSAENWK